MEEEKTTATNTQQEQQINFNQQSNSNQRKKKNEGAEGGGGVDQKKRSEGVAMAWRKEEDNDDGDEWLPIQMRREEATENRERRSKNLHREASNGDDRGWTINCFLSLCELSYKHWYAHELFYKMSE